MAAVPSRTNQAALRISQAKSSNKSLPHKLRHFHFASFALQVAQRCCHREPIVADTNAVDSLPNRRLWFRTPEHTEARGNNVLFVWRDAPRWLVADAELAALLSKFAQGATPADVVARRPEWSAQQREIPAPTASSLRRTTSAAASDRTPQAG
jgi:hypothetical protein